MEAGPGGVRWLLPHLPRLPPAGDCGCCHLGAGGRAGLGLAILTCCSTTLEPRCVRCPDPPSTELFFQVPTYGDLMGWGGALRGPGGQPEELPRGRAAPMTPPQAGQTPEGTFTGHLKAGTWERVGLSSPFLSLLPKFVLL